MTGVVWTCSLGAGAVGARPYEGHTSLESGRLDRLVVVAFLPSLRSGDGDLVATFAVAGARALAAAVAADVCRGVRFSVCDDVAVPLQ